MRRRSWWGTAAASLFSLAAGCTTVPIFQPHAHQSAEQASKPALAKKPVESTRSTTRADIENRSRPDSRRVAHVMRGDGVPRVSAPATEQVIAGNVVLSPALSTPASSRSIQDHDRSVGPIRLAQSVEADDLTVRQAEHVPTTESVLEFASAESAPDPATLPPDPGQSGEPTDEASSPKPELPVGYALNLGNVLYLADAQNPNVALARERINEAYARVDRADVLWMPSIRAGMNYVHHEGNVQDVVGDVFKTNKTGFYGGLGAGGTGSGSPTVPGVVAQFHLTDAIFQPKITAHQASSRQFGATAVRNDTLRNTAVAYLELQRAEQALAIAEEALVNTTRLVKLTGEYARTGQGLRSDYERMLAEQALRTADVFTRVEGVRVASARLAQLLHSDPAVRISSGEPLLIPLEMFERGSSASAFVATGLMRRPELAEQKHLVCEAVERLNREKYAPLVPSVLLGASYGGLGGGLGSSITNTDDRWDADALAYWELRNFGAGERAARNEMSSAVRQAQHREIVLMDQVAREVVEAHAQLLERERRIAAAKQAITAAERSYQLNETRIESAQGLPIETLQSIQALAAARQAYLNAVIDYNIAQFELCRATGWFDGEISTP